MSYLRLFGRRKCVGFTVLMGKRKGLIWVCKEEEKERFSLCSGAVQYCEQSHKKEKKKKKRKEKWRKEHTNTNMLLCSKLSIIFSINFSLNTLNTNRYDTLFCTSSIRAVNLTSKLKPDKRLIWTQRK